MAAALAALGTAPGDCYGRAWMLPCAPAETLRTLVARFATQLGRPLRISVMPRWMIRALGLVVPIVRELKEMAYQWDGPFIVDDSRFRAQFDVQPTDLDEAARATVAWAREHYGGGGQA